MLQAHSGNVYHIQIFKYKLHFTMDSICKQIFHFFVLLIIIIILPSYASPVTGACLCFNLFHLLTQKSNLERFSIDSNKFFHNFHLFESSFTCPGLRASGLARRLRGDIMSDCFPSFSK